MALWTHGPLDPWLFGPMALWTHGMWSSVTVYLYVCSSALSINAISHQSFDEERWFVTQLCPFRCIEACHMGVTKIHWGWMKMWKIFEIFWRTYKTTSRQSISRKGVPTIFLGWPRSLLNGSDHDPFGGGGYNVKNLINYLHGQSHIFIFDLIVSGSMCHVKGS